MAFLFKKFDTDNSDTLELNELMDMFKECNIKINEKIIRDLFREADIKKAGSLSLL